MEYSDSVSSISHDRLGQRLTGRKVFSISIGQPSASRIRTTSMSRLESISLAVEGHFSFSISLKSMILDEGTLPMICISSEKLYRFPMFLDSFGEEIKVPSPRLRSIAPISSSS